MAAIILLSFLFIFASIGWYWYADQRANTQRQLSLDLFWLEQSIAETLEGNRRILGNWGSDLIPEPGTTRPHLQAIKDFKARVENLSKSNPAILAVDYLSNEQQRVAGFPQYEERPANLPPVNDPYINEAIQTSLAMGQSTYSQVIEQYAPLWVLVVPIKLDNDTHGFLLATYDLDQLLSSKVPWWFVKRYELSLIDREHKSLAPSDSLEAPMDLTNDNVFTINFGPRNTGLSIQASPHQGEATKTLLIWLALTVLLLGSIVVFLLRLLRRWLQEKRMVRQALAKELRFREAMEKSLSTGLLAFNQQAEIIYVNPALCQLLGRPANELLQTSAPFSFWPPEKQEQCKHLHQAMITGNLAQFGNDGTTLDFLHASGKLISVRLFTSVLLDDQERPNGWMQSLYDITNEMLSARMMRERDELLQYTSRLTSLTEFASGIAHELNQPLAAIANYSAAAEQLMQQTKNTSDQSKEHLQEAVNMMRQEATRAGKIVHSMRNFIQKRQVQHARHDLRQLIYAPLTLLEPLLQRAQLNIKLELSDIPVWIECDAVMLEQVLFNLLRNAIEALPCSDATVGDRLRLCMRHEDEDSVLVTVADRGSGISDHHKLFQAFYTTKSDGMGLGLAICRTVIENHGGRLWAENQAGGGACFIFRLPLLR